MDKSKQFILWFDQLTIEDVPYVGGKNASLGEMYLNLTKKGINVPNGFAITAFAYQHLIKSAKIEEHMKNTLHGLNTHDVRDLADRGRKIRAMIRNAEFPPEIKHTIVEAYGHLCKQYGHDTDVAVRSSATAEDLPTASFAGQQETYLNIRGPEALIEACKNCFASLFTNRAISYREDKGFDHFKVYLSIGVQKMVRSDLACAGVMFSLDTETGFKDVAFITAAYGLGENVVQGAVNPDEYYVFKPTLKQGYKPIIKKEVGTKAMRMVYSEEGNKTTRNVQVPEKERKKFVLTDSEVLKLAEWAVIIEDHYSRKAKHWKPMDMEWAKDGKTNKLFIVQARPETVQSQKNQNILQEYELKEKGEVLAKGRSVGEKIGTGTANIIRDVKDIHNFKKGQVLITEMTDPDWEPIMKMAAAIVTNRGGRTCFTGDTILLTNKGFIKFKDVFKNYEGLKVLSLNKNTLKIEWKPVIASMKRKSEVIEVSVSQTGTMKGNNLRLTPNHKMISYQNGELTSEEIEDILTAKDMLVLAQKIPSLDSSTLREQQLAYLLGAISTDGHIYLTERHGEVQFIQKPTEAKQKFISHVQKCMKNTFNKEFRVSEKKISSSYIRGKPAIGQANAYRCYSKLIAAELGLEQEGIVETLLTADKTMVYNFLAGVIDGDGSYHNNRINIYCSKENLLQAIIVSCLRIGTLPQVTINRNIHNIQIVEKIDEILGYAKRVKGKNNRKIMGTRFFSAKQLFGDVKGQLRLRKDKNLLIDEKTIKKEIKNIDKNTIKKIKQILDSDTRMQRVNFVQQIGVEDVYNITVADNHNYVVFTDRYSPIIVNNCHAAIISRELGIPCVVGTLDGTEKVRHGQKVTVSCTEGDDGYVYRGILRYRINEINLKKMPQTKTKIMMNLGNPDQAFDLSFLPNDGVGLAREEFIVNSYIKIHPRALIEFHNLKDEKLKRQIQDLTSNYKDKKQYFIDQLARGIATIAAAFYPKPVILRFSDFKTNEYANLIGGHLFEPKEDNPMIGWRGASRYYRPGYREGFALECKAIKKVREEMGLKNVEVMIPFCRTVEEGKKVLAEMAKNKLKKGHYGLRVICMCEIPSNVILAEQFLKIFDGFSIGTNDLTQLTLGLDRDSELVADIYDERNKAVKDLVARVIQVANKKGRYIGLCGDAPSTYPEFAQFLVSAGIKSMSLSPDAVVKTTLKVAEMEKKLHKKSKKSKKR